MPSNPMQRKVRNSFLLGILVMLIIAILIGAIVFLLVIKPNMEKEEEQKTAYVYRLKEGVTLSYGQEVTSSMVECVEAPVTTSNTTDFITAKKQDTATGKISDVAFPSGYKTKLDLKGGTILTQSMLYEEETEDSLRYVEYNVITIPTTLDIDNYVDIRFRLSNAQDLIVISKKQIISLYENTIGLYLTEDEILLLNSAIVESYTISASELYMSTYVEPSLQEAAVKTYTPTTEVISLIHSNENIVTTAKNALVEKYNNSTVRTTIDNTKATYSTEASQNIEEGMQEQIQEAKKARENYLSEMEGY